MIYFRHKGNSTVQLLAVLLLAAAALLVVYKPFQRPCQKPINYSIGQVDKNFGLNEQQFLNILQSAEGVWEQAIDKDLFVYNPEAKLKVNLIYDERQRQTQEEMKLRSQIENQNLTYDQLVDKYDALVVEYQKKLEEYNREVEKWNSRGGAPEMEYRRLESDREELREMAAQIKNLADIINSLIEEQNLRVEQYNEQFSGGTAFDQGEYRLDLHKEEINIYQFRDTQDLLLVSAHEFGHALGLEHVSDPKSIMYHLMDKQDQEDLKLTPSDIIALKTLCRVN